MLVMVVVGINSALGMVALVLIRTACRRPGLRDDNYSIEKYFVESNQRIL